MSLDTTASHRTAGGARRAGASAAPARLRVCAVLVVTEGAEWLSIALRTLARQTHPALDLVVIDNASTDDSAAILYDRVADDRVVRLDRRVGFGAAVAVAARHEAAAGADALLLLHDDLALPPDAIATLADALLADPLLSAVGPKLREWAEEPVLQEVGMTIDRLGRAEALLDPGERDQGQHDQRHDVLYVSTAGMLVRREALQAVGGFDERYPAFRDDLDLCWRLWLAGGRVAVVPAAVGYHVAAASRYVRLRRRDRPWELRYLAERHTLATLLKCYGAGRLVGLLPVLALLALAKMVGFVLTRRLRSAWAVGRAWLWNAAQAPATLRRRRAVQAGRARSDGELARLFAPGLPRLRSYVEAGAEWVTGGSTRAIVEDDGTSPEELAAVDAGAVGGFVRRHLVGVVGLALLVVYLFGVLPLLGAGPITGGQVAAWPAQATDFLRVYASPTSAHPLGSDALSSPVQAVLGLVSLLGFGSSWLAQRLVVLGLVPLAWMAAVRAGRFVTRRPGPRVLGATLYAGSPVVLGALGDGRLDALLLAALLPALVVLGLRTVAPIALRRGDERAAIASAWRSTGLLGLALALALAGAPHLWPVTVAVVAVLAGVVTYRGRGVARLGVAVLGAGLVLGPWLLDLAGDGLLGPVATPGAGTPWWRLAMLAPDGTPLTAGVFALLTAAGVVGVVVTAGLLGWRLRPGVIGVFLAVVVASVLATWWWPADTATAVWVPGLLLPGVLALGSLAAVAASWMERSLRVHAFGARQVVVAVGAVLTGLGVLVSIGRVGALGTDGLGVGAELVPPYVLADGEQVGPYAVLLLDQRGGEVRFEVIDGRGETMLRAGTVPDADVVAQVSGAVADVVGAVEPGAAARLGLLGIRYVVVDIDADAATSPEQAIEAPDADEERRDLEVALDEGALVGALDAQPALDPAPSGTGRVYRVTTWVPEAVVVPSDLDLAVITPEDAEALDDGALRPAGPLQAPTGYDGTRTPDSDVLLARPPDAQWRARSAGVRLEAQPAAPVGAGATRFLAPGAAGTQEGEVPVTLRVDATGRAVQLILQAIVVVLLASLVLRPPGRGRRAERAAARLPEALRVGDERVRA